MNKLDQAREQVFYAETTAELATARQDATSARERLARLMGLWDGDLDFRLPDQLPALPRRPRSLPSIEVDAVGHRLDLQIARMELAALAKSLDLDRGDPLRDAARPRRDRRAPMRDPASAQPFRERGFELEFQIPMFDGGEVRVRQATETYNQAFNRLTEKAINVRSEARDAYRVYRSSYDIASHYRTEVLPLRKIISDEMQLRFSSMQVDVFALLTEARQRIARVAQRHRRHAQFLAGAVRPADRGQWRRQRASADGDTRTTNAATALLGGERALNGAYHVFTKRISRHRHRAGQRDRDQRPRAGGGHSRSAGHGQGDDAAAAASLQAARDYRSGRHAERLDRCRGA